MRVAVIGAGIIGTSIALELRKRGAEVTLVDRDEPGRGCSFGNSGAISPSSVAPLAMPGVLASVPKMLVDSQSPLYLPWTYLPRAASWLWQFVASARPSVVAASAEKLAALHADALAAHRQMTTELGVPELFLQRGHLHLYPDEQALAKDRQGWELRKAHGFAFEQLGRPEIEALEPRVNPRYRVGIFLADHATILDPFRYVQAMACAAAAAGVRIVRGTVSGVQAHGSQWSLRGAAAMQDEAFDHAIVAAGAWSRTLLEPLGFDLPLESQRGYHLQFRGARDVVSRTVVLADKKVFFTPMEEGLRVGGTVEIAGLDAPADPRRAAVLERVARQNFVGLDDVPHSEWMGHRPCMPDSVPFVGRLPGRPGLWIATGHGHLGLTDSLPTARRIADELFASRA